MDSDLRYRPWSDVCTDLLEVILGKFSDGADIFRFRCVCKNWSSCKSKLKPPCLLLPHRLGDGNRSFLNLSSGEIMDFTFPQASGKAVVGSCSGWLLLLDGKSLKVSLLNPSINSYIEPPIPSMRYPFGTVYDMIPQEVNLRTVLDLVRFYLFMSGHPDSPSECIVAFSMDDTPNFAFFSLEDRDWSVVNLDDEMDTENLSYCDCDDTFYVLLYGGNFKTYDRATGIVSTIDSLKMPKGRPYPIRSSCGFVLVVEVIEDKDSDFHLYKMEKDSLGNLRWVQLEGLGAWSVYLLQSEALSVSFLDGSGFRKNCICHPRLHEKEICFYNIQSSSVDSMTYRWDQCFRSSCLHPVWIYLDH